MARPLRIEYEGAFYHVTARGNERKRIYDSTPDYEKFRSYLKRAQRKAGDCGLRIAKYTSTDGAVISSSIFPEDIKECLSNSLEESWEERVWLLERSSQ